MRRPVTAAFPLAAAALCAAGAGCAGPTAGFDPLGRADPPAAAVTAEAGTLADEPTPPPPAEPPPFAEPAASPTAAGKHDAATAALMAEELALAAPADRAALAAEWADLDTAMVEQVIRIRRMVRQLDAESAASPAAGSPGELAAPAVAAPDPFAPPPAAVPPVGAVVPAVVPAVAPAESSAFPPATPAEGGRPMVDPNLRPAAYRGPVPPAGPSPGTGPTPGTGGAADPSPLFPGAPLPPRTAERLPTNAALVTPGASAVSADPGGYPAAPTPSAAGPTGFGTAPDAAFAADRAPLTPPPPAPAGGDYADRLEDLLAAAVRRERRLRDAVVTAPDPEARAAAEAALAEAGVHLRLLRLVAGEHGRALEAVPDLPPAEQEFWQHSVWALSAMLDEQSIPDPADRATQAVASLRTAATKLSGEAKLTLRNVNFCHRVDSFGNAVPFDRDEFTPNQPVLIYAEVENFTSEPNLDGRFRTQTRSTVQIFEAGGERLIETLPLDEPVTVDLCDRHRQDYFLVYDLKIPARIGLGPHVMKLTVEDALGGRTVQTRLNFTVK